MPSSFRLKFSLPTPLLSWFRAIWIFRTPPTKPAQTTLKIRARHVAWVVYTPIGDIRIRVYTTPQRLQVRTDKQCIARRIKEMRMKLLLFTLVISIPLLVAAQEGTAVHSAVSGFLDGANVEKWTEREKAFTEMPAIVEVEKQEPAEAERLKVGLIHLLVVENADVQRAKQTGTRFTTEEHSDYYGNLIGAVAELHDERAIPALLGAITTGGMASRGLASFGDKAFASVLNRIKDPDPMVRSSVLFTVRNMLRMHTIKNPASQAGIADVVRSSLADPEFGVRDSAISVIEYLDKRGEFVPALEDLAHTDPIKLPGKPDDGGDGDVFYPVRQHARRVLRKIANHEPAVMDSGGNR